MEGDLDILKIAYAGFAMPDSPKAQPAKQKQTAPPVQKPITPKTETQNEIPVQSTQKDVEMKEVKRSEERKNS